jgi:hypothetical protein
MEEKFADLLARVGLLSQHEQENPLEIRQDW